MKQRKAVCPSCGAPVEFRIGGTMVTVCEFCETAVGRGDRDVEDFGKVAELALTDPAVHIGTTGHFRGNPFTVIGRVQYAHAAGGFWDEFYLRLPGDKIAWLSDSQGKLHLMFERPVREKSPLPDFQSLRIGKHVRYGNTELVVTEKGVAKAHSAEGEIPWHFRPGVDHAYADLEGRDVDPDKDDERYFATFDYSAEPNVAYVGKLVTVDELDLSHPDWMQSSESVPVAALQLNCPHCGGTLTLHQPDETLRVGCPHCSSLLDASRGKLALFKTLNQKELHPPIPLGNTGKMFGVTYTAIGFLERYAKYEGQIFPWSETLLHAPGVGYRWLVCNDRHWSFVEPISLADLRHSHRSARYQGRSFKLYDRGTAYVRGVVGEFYWKVSKGDIVQTEDYIAPPNMISVESSFTLGTEERVASMGTYVTAAEVQAAFATPTLLHSWSVGVIQPFPAVHGGVWLSWMGFIAYAIIIHVVFQQVSGSGKKDPDGWMLFYAILFFSVVPIGIAFYKYTFEVSRWKNSDYSPYASSE